MNFFNKGVRRASKYPGHNPSRPATVDGRYDIAFAELTDGYTHAFREDYRTGVLYSKKPNHPADPRCPGCAGT